MTEASHYPPPIRLPSGSEVVREIHRSPAGLVGVVAHWGERFTDSVLRERIIEVFPEAKLSDDTGFTEIYRQREGLSRPEAIADELAVAAYVVQEALKARSWKPEDVDALFLASGVPIVDDPRYDDYAKIVAEITGLSPSIMMRNKFHACNSGANAFFSAANEKELEGKKVLVLAIEGVTALTPDFDPEKADSVSMQVFSNGAAAFPMIPGKDFKVLNHRHHVFPDIKRALSAKMHYERLLPEEVGETIIETLGNTSMIRMPVPENGRLLDMKGIPTTLFFSRAGTTALTGIYDEHMQEYPGSHISYVAAHHPSWGVQQVLMRKLEKADPDMQLDIPWVVTDGNSSAATTLIAKARLLNRATPGTRAIVFGYGAGGSADAGVVEYR